MSDKFYKAKATFRYVVGIVQDVITVGAESAHAKSDDDWKISLALQAGSVVAEKYKQTLSAVTLSYVSMDLERKDE